MATFNADDLAEQLPDPVDEDNADAAIAQINEVQGQPDKPAQAVEDEVVPGTAVATLEAFDITTTSENWPHDFLEFKGDKLGIRLPTMQALAAFQLACSRYVPVTTQNDLTGLFIARHLSPESYARVFSRLMDPDEDEYTVDTVGELFNAIITAAVKSDEK